MQIRKVIIGNIEQLIYSFSTVLCSITVISTNTYATALETSLLPCFHGTFLSLELTQILIRWRQSLIDDRVFDDQSNRSPNAGGRKCWWWWSSIVCGHDWLKARLTPSAGDNPRDYALTPPFEWLAQSVSQCAQNEVDVKLCHCDTGQGSMFYRSIVERKNCVCSLPKCWRVKVVQLKWTLIVFSLRVEFTWCKNSFNIGEWYMASG